MTPTGLLVLLTTFGAPASASAPLRIEAGGEHTCLLQHDGEVRCFGSGAFGQNGRADRQSTAVASAVVDLPPMVGLSLGRAHTCAFDEAGAVYCWGRNHRGQLGDGTPFDRSLPLRVEGVPPVVAVEAGAHHTCATTRDLQVYCWGDNRYGQLGNGSSQAWLDRPAPMRGVEQARQVAAGYAHTCVRTTTGALFCAGANYSGQLGVETFAAARTPMAVPAPDGAPWSGLVEVRAGQAHTCATDDAGQVWCWGAGAGGQLGDGRTFDRHSPAAVPAFAGAEALVLGENFTCAHLSSTLQCAGGRFGPLAQTWEVPSQTQWSAGGRHLCGVSPTTPPLCLGDNDHGQLGSRSEATLDPWRPTRVPLVSRARSIVRMTNTICALLDDDTRWCWGDGNPTPTTVAVSPPPSAAGYCERQSGRTLSCRLGRGRSLIRLQAALRQRVNGANFACILDDNRHVSCLGHGLRGELGQGLWSPLTERPVRVLGVTGAVELVAGRRFACARMPAGQVWCWGDGAQGQLGDGTLRAQPRASPVALARPATALYAGDAFACAADPEGQVACWGALGHPTDRPRVVEGIPPLVELATGPDSICGRSAAGEVWCWGNASDGQRGLGTTLQTGRPLPIPAAAPHR